MLKLKGSPALKYKIAAITEIFNFLNQRLQPKENNQRPGVQVVHYLRDNVQG